MDINVLELKQRLENKEKFIFIDVREPYEYEEFNLGADLKPLGSFQYYADELLPHKDEEIILHCRSGKRSGSAQHYLQQLGFSNVRNLEGGVLAWIEAFGAIKPQQ